MDLKLAVLLLMSSQLVGCKHLNWAHPGSGAMDNIIYNNMNFIGSFMEGDIPRIQNGATQNRLWPNGNVPYVIAATFSSDERRTIRNALNLITKEAPCITFTEIQSNFPQDYVEVISESGCWSYVGRNGDKQQMSLMKGGCFHHGIIVHEFLHALGFHHEQSRPDRDEFVEIKEKNIVEGMKNQFDISKDINSLGVQYDPVSIMHYGNYAFSKSSDLPTIVWKADPSKKLGGEVLTKSDILQLNRLYKCGSEISTTQPPATQPPVTQTTTTGCVDEDELCMYYADFCNEIEIQTLCKNTCGKCSASASAGRR